MPYIVEANETVRGNYKIISNGNHVQICFLPANIWNHNPRGGIKLGGLSLAKPKRVYVVRSSVMSHDYIRIVKQFSQSVILLTRPSGIISVILSSRLAGYACSHSLVSYGLLPNGYRELLAFSMGHDAYLLNRHGFDGSVC